MIENFLRQSSVEQRRAKNPYLYSSTRRVHATKKKKRKGEILFYDEEIAELAGYQGTRRRTSSSHGILVGIPYVKINLVPLRVGERERESSTKHFFNERAR